MDKWQKLKKVIDKTKFCAFNRPNYCVFPGNETYSDAYAASI